MTDTTTDHLKRIKAARRHIDELKDEITVLTQKVWTDVTSAVTFTDDTGTAMVATRGGGDVSTVDAARLAELDRSVYDACCVPKFEPALWQALVDAGKVPDRLIAATETTKHISEHIRITPLRGSSSQ